MTDEMLNRINAYWRASNYLACCSIYLKDNAMLKEPLKPAHIKPRLLGHWGTTPGINFIYAHLNHLINNTGANILLIIGPGHGAPAILANTFLEGTLVEHHPDITQDIYGMKKLFRRFSTPYGFPSHVGPHIPGSMHEGGELGYSLVHAFGAVFDNPDLISVCVVGDGEAETGPLEGSWKSVGFLNPVRDGAVLPVLHLNGYKIAGPTVLGRTDNAHLNSLFSGYGYKVYFVEGEDPMKMHEEMSETLSKAYDQIISIQKDVRKNGFKVKPEWPMIILRTLKGWTCPKELNGLQLEGTFRAHQVPITDVVDNPEHLKILEEWMKSYRHDELFGKNGEISKDLLDFVPEKSKRIGANINANGGHLLEDLNLTDFTKYAVDVKKPGVLALESTKRLGEYIRDVYKRNPVNFRLFSPDETASNRLQAVFEVTDRCSVNPVLNIDDHVSFDGRVMEVLSEHLCEGWLEGYLLTGRHGIFVTYEAFASIVDSMVTQFAKWIEVAHEFPWRKPLSSLNIILSSHVWRQDHNGFSHQGPGFIDNVINKRSSVVRIYFPPDANSLLSVMDHCLRSRNYVNVIVAGKQPELQWLDMDAAKIHCQKGISIFEWAGNKDDGNPDIIFACAGDVPTLETNAAASLLKQYAPEIKTRVINIVDLMTLSPADYHPHGMDPDVFLSLFQENTPVVFAFHGYIRIIHDLVHGRPNPERFHVRGYIEEGATTTPFDMVIRNKMSRFDLAIVALKNITGFKEKYLELISLFEEKIASNKAYIQEYLDDEEEIKHWTL